MQIIKEYIWSDELKNQGRMNIKHFIRERVLTFPCLVLYFINLAKKSLQVSLNEFCKLADLLSVTKQAFSKARVKLAPNTFILLNRKLVEEYYSDNEIATWQGYRLIAIDGSDIQLPQVDELKSSFGTAKNQLGSSLAMAKLSYAYDVLNRITLDAQLDRCKTSERDLAIKHVEAIRKLKHDETKDLYIFDRGYPSLGMIFYLSSLQKNFLMRCTASSCFSKVQKAFKSGRKDTIVRLYAKDANDEQKVELKKKLPGEDLKNIFIDLRVVVITLNTGEKELLITSLTDQSSYSVEEFGVLYNFRWGIEENYKWHKSILELENFSGHSKHAIEQEVFSLVFTANIASLIMQEAQDEIDEENKKKGLKHAYRINKRIAVASLRDQLMIGLLAPEFDMEGLCNNLKAEIKKHVCPVRPGRKYARKVKGRLKYALTTRKCI